jgi:hypothetical protein
VRKGNWWRGSLSRRGRAGVGLAELIRSVLECGFGVVVSVMMCLGQHVKLGWVVASLHYVPCRGGMRLAAGARRSLWRGRGYSRRASAGALAAEDAAAAAAALFGMGAILSRQMAQTALAMK